MPDRLPNPSAESSPPSGSHECDCPLMRELFTVHHMMMRVGDRLTRSDGLTASRWLLLGAIDDADGGATISELAERAMMSVQSVSRMLSAMEDEGFVVRTPHPDGGRAILAGLTPRSRAWLDASPELAKRFQASLLAEVASDRVETVRLTLNQMIENLQRFEEDLAQNPEQTASEFPRSTDPKSRTPGHAAPVEDPPCNDSCCS